MPTVQTTLPPPPLRFSDLPKPLQAWHLNLQRHQPLNLADTSAGSEVVELPPAGLDVATGQTNQNQELTYRKVSADANTLTVTGSADGPQVLTKNSGSGSVVRFKSDGTDWWVIS